VLAHYAKKENLAMFQHVWNYERGDRGWCMFINYNKSPWSTTKEDTAFDFYMRKYKKNYCNTEKIHKRYFHILMNGIGSHRYLSSAIVLSKKVLPGSGFNIFTLKCRKEQARVNKHYRLHNLIPTIKDANLLVAIIGGCVEPYMFKKIFWSISKEMVESLFEMGVVELDGRDKYGNSAHDYYKCRMNPPMYTGGLAYVNCWM
jgi:hypothetical protein